MKISYKVLKNLIPNIPSPEKISEMLIMHTAEVEKIVYEGENLKDVIIGEILEVKKHSGADRLNLCKVKLNSGIKQIVCGAPNVKAGIKIPVAIVGARLSPDFIIQKTKIRGEISEGMICSEDELGLKEERQNGIMILPGDSKLGISMREYLGKDDIILEIDNKAINHRPDLFSHIGVVREICTICGYNFNFSYQDKDFSKLKSLGIKNDIPKIVRRYIGLKVLGVKNIKSPEYIIEVLNSNDDSSKGLLVDITNYCLYLYGQPVHCFDSDTIKGNIRIRFAKKGESFIALNKEKYNLGEEDIVIADDEKILALGGIIGGLNSSVTDLTKNIVIESAHFDQAVVRKTGKRLGIRTDALNIFEKDISLEMQNLGISLILSELEKFFKTLKLDGYSDIYPEKQSVINIDFDLKFINDLIGMEYREKDSIEIFKNLGIEKKGYKLIIPFWRKDLTTKADMAEEVARINGYDKVKSTIPRINLGAVLQDNMYKLKNDTRSFLVNKGFFDLYNYSFVNDSLMKKFGSEVDNLVPLKNFLSEDATHMKDSLIPNLMDSLEKNIRGEKKLKLFEIEKIFRKDGNSINENYEISGIMLSESKIVYYDIQDVLRALLKKLVVQDFFFKKDDKVPSFYHSGRTACIDIGGKKIGYVGEINPIISKRFDIKQRVGFFTINANLLKNFVYSKMKTDELSSFQENNFDLSFIVDKKYIGREIFLSIKGADEKLIKKVELFDIYEDSKKFFGKRSLSFSIFIQSNEETLDDKVKNELIKKIVKKVKAKGGILRGDV